MKKILLVMFLLSGMVFAQGNDVSEKNIPNNDLQGKCNSPYSFSSTKEECDQCKNRSFIEGHCVPQIRRISRKPIIYLYPTVPTEVKVSVGKPENLTHTYPKYTDGWSVLAHPNGNLTDKKGHSYYALYWEGIHTNNSKDQDGFIVKGSDTIPFLEEKLAILGLSEREANEFIIYWLPVLEKNKYNLIRFATKEEIEDNMPLFITPKPDTLIRVMMKYKPVQKSKTISPQQLPSTPKRTGFVAVEWGGTLLK